MTRVHDFQERNNWSLQNRWKPYWDTAYGEYFHGYEGRKPITDVALQKQGVDVIVSTSAGKGFLIDEKVRDRHDTGDILLELGNRYPSGHRTKGWIMKPLKIDFLAYAFAPSSICYVLPFPALQRAFFKHKVAWWAAYRSALVEARNASYVTCSLPIPTRVLLSAISDASRVGFSNDHA